MALWRKAGYVFNLQFTGPFEPAYGSTVWELPNARVMFVTDRKGRQKRKKIVQGDVNMLDVIGWLIFGFFVGALARAMIPGEEPGQVFVTMILGMIGSLIGGFFGRIVFAYGGVFSASQITKPGFLLGLTVAVFSAVLLLVGYRELKRRNDYI